jgi:hypothetical protein
VKSNAVELCKIGQNHLENRLPARCCEGVTEAGCKHRCGCDYIKGGASPQPSFPLVVSHLRIQTTSLPAGTGVATQVFCDWLQEKWWIFMEMCSCEALANASIGIVFRVWGKITCEDQAFTPLLLNNVPF